MRCCTLQHDGAFTSSVTVPCPVPAAYKPHVPGLTSAVRKQVLSVLRKINIPYSSKHVRCQVWLQSSMAISVLLGLKVDGYSLRSGEELSFTWIWIVDEGM